MVQPKNLITEDKDIQLHNIGCLGKITSFKETEDARLIVELKGMIRFKVINEIKSNKKYRVCEINFQDYYQDLENKKEDLITIAQREIEK